MQCNTKINNLQYFILSRHVFKTYLLFMIFITAHNDRSKVQVGFSVQMSLKMHITKHTLTGAIELFVV